MRESDLSMKILQVSCEGLGNGGIQSVIMNICRNIREAQFDVLLFTNEIRHYDEEFLQLGGRIFRIPKYEGRNRIRRKIDYYIRFPRIFINTYKIIKQEGNYDVIHCHNDLESGICNLAAFFAGVKIRISHAHTSNSKFSAKNLLAYLYRKLLQKLMKLTTNIVVGCTEEAVISIFGEKHLKKPYTHILSNPIDVKKFTRSQLVLENKKNKYIVHVGRFDENKNQLFILNLLPYIIPTIPNVKLQLVGSGDEYKEKLINKVKELNLEHYVVFLPPDSNVKEVLENADVFIFPSKSEGFGIVLVEAQSMEVPCLVSDTVPRSVDCGLCSFISLSENYEVWAKHAINLMNMNHNMKLDKRKLMNLDLKVYIHNIKLLYGGSNNENRYPHFS